MEGKWLDAKRGFRLLLSKIYNFRIKIL